MVHIFNFHFPPLFGCDKPLLRLFWPSTLQLRSFFAPVDTPLCRAGMCQAGSPALSRAPVPSTVYETLARSICAKQDIYPAPCPPPALSRDPDFVHRFFSLLSTSCQACMLPVHLFWPPTLLSATPTTPGWLFSLPRYSFSTLPEAAMTLFFLTVSNNWNDLLYPLVDSVR